MKRNIVSIEQVTGARTITTVHGLRFVGGKSGKKINDMYNKITGVFWKRVHVKTTVVDIVEADNSPRGGGDRVG